LSADGILIPHLTASPDRCTQYFRLPIMKFFVLFLLLLTGCDIDSKKTGIYNHSQSIKESKQNGVFIQTLKVDNPIINIGNNNTDTIKEIWIEHWWKYERKIFKAVVKKDSSMQIAILFGKLSDNSYNGSILLENRNGYYSWNGVLFDSFLGNADTIYVVRKTDTEKKIVDTIIVAK